MIAQDALRFAIERLRGAGVADPPRDARLLLAEALAISSDRLTLVLTEELSPESATRFDGLIEQRVKRQPVSQILGRRQFYGRDFVVTPDVLDPRPETETLVYEALQLRPQRVLDIGTGSGCILLSLLAEQPNAIGTAVDVSKPALDVASKNAESLDLSDRVQFLQSDWFSDISGQFDMIVSNPPYIDEAEWTTLEAEPRQWEPKIALTPGPDGLAPYGLIAEQAPSYLVEDGWLLVEIGWQQGAAVQEIFNATNWANVRVVQDLGGKDRVVMGQKPQIPLQKSLN